ncbi:phosphate acyltransferase PlsX [Candidatus Margulisiibacteriota bacterium]
MKIAVDAMGGDFAPGEIIAGVHLAIKENPIEIVLVGDQGRLEKAISAIPGFPYENVSIVHASENVEMSDSPMESFKKKKDSSIRIGLELIKDKRAQGFVSAGNTGAVMLASTMLLGRISGIDRPAIAAVLPRKNGKVIVLDVGSNVDCKAKYLAQFAKMGSVYAEIVLDIKSPKVGLLNIGEEKSKGNFLTQSAFSLISGTSLNFIGNIEGKDVLSGHVDVVVCDGFVGNAILKFGEGATNLFADFFKNEARSSLMSKIGLLFLKPALRRFKKEYDYIEYGGAPLLGVSGISIIAHGKSKSIAIKNAIKICVKSINNNIVERISEGIK